MATVTKENIGLLHEKLTVTIEKNDYQISFEKALKEYSKKANIPGFRKGMVPAGLIKKMYGSSVFTDEILRTADKELINHIQAEKLDIFAQPLPMEQEVPELDMNNPADYTFHFEIGVKPDFAIVDLGSAAITRYVVSVTDEQIDTEVDRLQNRHGNMADRETVEGDDSVLNLLLKEATANGDIIENGTTKDNSLLLKYFTEDTRKNLLGKKVGDTITIQLSTAFAEKEREWIIGDLGIKEDATAADKYFVIEITKIGLLEKRALNEEFFEQIYPAKEIKTEVDFRNKVKAEIETYWGNQAKNQIHDQVFHVLTEQTAIALPETFLKKWVKTSGESPKTDEEVEKDFPTFLNQLKWTLITEKIIGENTISVSPDELKNFARQQLFSYMGGANLSDDQPWVNDYVEKMMKDKKYVEESYNRIQTQKIFEWAETKLNPTDKEISAADFTKMVEAHQH